MAVISCPNEGTLRSVLLGQLPVEQAEPLEQHLLACDTCQHVANLLQLEDPLLDACRAQRAIGGSERDVVAGLLTRLRKLNPAEPSTMSEYHAEADSASEGATARADLDPIDFLSPPLQPGELGRLGSYRVLRVLGAGGMGVVFEAEDTQLARRVALKVMKPALAASELHRQRFLREARLMASIKDDHVVTVHQVGEDGGLPYLAMELLEGETLAARLQRETVLPLPEAVRIARECTLGLAAAHRKGLIHRDVKPGNLWLEKLEKLEALPGERGASASRYRVKLLDFGLARAREDEHLTRHGTVLGTPAYMAPEQARCEEVDARSDLFSLGCVLYRLTTGAMPFRGTDTMSQLMSLASDLPLPPLERNAAVPPALSAIILRLLEKDPAKRPATAPEVLQELERMEREMSAPALSVAVPDAPRWRRKWSWMAAAAILLAVTAAVLPDVIVRIRDRDGKVTEVKVPGDPKEIEIEKDGKVIKVPLDGDKKPDPLSPIKGGDPLSPLALVGRPAEIKGVQSWTIETIRPRSVRTEVRYSSDGRWLAVASGDSTVRLLEPKTGKVARVLVGPAIKIARQLYGVAWSPDSKTLALFGGDSSVRLLDVATGRVLRELRSAGAEMTWAVWSPSGKMLASYAQNEGVYLWNVETGKAVGRLKDAREFVSWSANGKLVVASPPYRPGPVHIWDVEAGTVIREFKEADAASFSPDGKLLAVGGGSAQLQLWESDGSKLIRQLSCIGNIFSWSLDGKRLACGHGTKGNLQVFDVGGKQLLHSLDEGAWGGVICVSWSSDGETIAASYTGLREPPGVRCWNSRSGELLHTLQEHPSRANGPVTWSPDGKILAASTGSSSGQGTVAWDASVGKLLWQSSLSMRTLSWTPSGKLLAGSEEYLPNALFDATTGREVRKLQGMIRPSPFLAWSPDGKLVASGSDDKTVRVWKAESGETLHVLKVRDGNVIQLAWSHDGKTLAAGLQGGGGVWLWDIASGKERRELLTKEGGVLRIAWSADDKLLAGATDGRMIQLWDAATGNRLELLEGHKDEIVALGFDADGETLVSIDAGRKARFWKAELGRLLRSTSVANLGVFSGDRRFLAEGMYISVHICEVESGRPRGAIVTLRGDIAFAISADGHHNGGPRAEKELVYVVQTDKGQETLTPEEFAKRYNWKNDPARVRLTGK